MDTIKTEPVVSSSSTPLPGDIPHANSTAQLNFLAQTLLQFSHMSPESRPTRSCRSNTIPECEIEDNYNEDEYEAESPRRKTSRSRRDSPRDGIGSRGASHPISSRHFTSDRFGITVEDLLDAGYIKPGKGVITFCNSDSVGDLNADCTVTVDGVARTLARTALMIANKSRAAKALPARRGINAWSYCFYDNEKLDAIRDRLARDVQANNKNNAPASPHRQIKPSRESSISREQSPARRRGRQRVSLKDITMYDLLNRGFVREGKSVLRLGSLDGELADINANGSVTWNGMTGDLADVALEAYNYRRHQKNLPSRRNIDVLMHCFFNNVALDILRAECAGLMEEQLADGMVEDKLYSASFDESTLEKNMFVSEEESEHLSRAMERSRSNSRTRNYNDDNSDDDDEEENLSHRKSSKAQKDQNSPSRFGVTMKDLMQAGLLLPGKCSITFRRSEDTADLLDDGSVVYHGDVTSVGIAALQVTNAVRENNRLPPRRSVNAWQVALYDGHKLDDYRQEYVTLVKKEKLNKRGVNNEDEDVDIEGMDDHKRSISPAGDIIHPDPTLLLPAAFSDLLMAVDNSSH